MAKLSVVIAARDESKNLSELLPELKWADEVVVLVDDRSQDETLNLAKKLGAKVKTAKFDNFSQFKNQAIEMATGDWLLLLDADERVSDELRREIEEVLSESRKKVAYKFPWKNHIGRTWLRHGGLYPDYHIRLFKKGKAIYHGEVHEQLTIDGEVGTLSGTVIHYTYPDVDGLRRKVNLYSDLEARKVDATQKSSAQAAARAIKRFIKVYFIRLGFLDGWYGLINAWELARYQWRVHR